MAEAGIGLWPDNAAPATPDFDQATRDLSAFGYGYLDQDLDAVVRAFQRHFRPKSVTGHLDAETMGRLKALVALKSSPD